MTKDKDKPAVSPAQQMHAQQLEDLAKRIRGGQLRVEDVFVENETKDGPPRNGWATLEMTGKQTITLKARAVKHGA